MTFPEEPSPWIGVAVARRGAPRHERARERLTELLEGHRACAIPWDFSYFPELRTHNPLVG